MNAGETPTSEIVDASPEHVLNTAHELVDGALEESTEYLDDSEINAAESGTGDDSPVANANSENEPAGDGLTDQSLAARSDDCESTGQEPSCSTDDSETVPSRPKKPPPVSPRAISLPPVSPRAISLPPLSPRPPAETTPPACSPRHSVGAPSVSPRAASTKVPSLVSPRADDRAPPPVSPRQPPPVTPRPDPIPPPMHVVAPLLSPRVDLRRDDDNDDDDDDNDDEENAYENNTAENENDDEEEGDEQHSRERRSSLRKSGKSSSSSSSSSRSSSSKKKKSGSHSKKKKSPSRGSLSPRDSGDKKKSRHRKKSDSSTSLALAEAPPDAETAVDQDGLPLKSPRHRHHHHHHHHKKREHKKKQSERRESGESATGDDDAVVVVDDDDKASARSRRSERMKKSTSSSSSGGDADSRPSSSNSCSQTTESSRPSSQTAESSRPSSQSEVEISDGESSSVVAAPPGLVPPAPPLEELSEAEKQLRKRRFIVNEILSTERVYVSSLNSAVSVYMQPMKQLAAQVDAGVKGAPSWGPTGRDIKAIFSEVEIILQFNKTMLVDMTKCMSTWDNETSMLGAIFLEMTYFLRVYQTFINNYDNSLETLRRLRTNPQFDAFMTKTASSFGSQSIDLSSFLIMPVQRIPRYVLLLQDLVKNTNPDHPDYGNLTQALEKMRETANGINSSKRAADSTRRLMSIQSSLRGYSESLVQPHRKLEHEGPIDQDRYMFLFTDLLVWVDYTAGKTREQDTYRYVDQVRLPNIDVQPVEEDPLTALLPVPAAGAANKSELPPNAWSVVVAGRGRVEHRFGAPTASERDTWVNAVREACARYVQQECEVEVSAALGALASQRPRAMGAGACCGGRMWFFGGVCAGETNERVAELLCYEPEAQRWTLLEPAEGQAWPAPRSACTFTALDDERMLLFGGYDGTQRFNDTWLYLVESGQWQKLPQTGRTPAARSGHSAAVIGKRLFVFGGATVGKTLNDLCVLDVSSLSWVNVHASGTPPKARFGHRCVGIEQRFLVYGGASAFGAYDDLFALDCNTLQWHEYTTVGDRPPPVQDHSMFVLHNELYLYGGRANGCPLQGLYVLEPNSMLWHSASLHSALTAERVFLYEALVAADEQNQCAYLLGGRSTATTSTPGCVLLRVRQRRLLKKISGEEDDEEAENEEQGGGAAFPGINMKVVQTEKKSRSNAITTAKNMSHGAIASVTGVTKGVSSLSIKRSKKDKESKDKESKDKDKDKKMKAISKKGGVGVLPGPGINAAELRRAFSTTDFKTRNDRIQELDQRQYQSRGAGTVDSQAATRRSLTMAPRPSPPRGGFAGANRTTSPPVGSVARGSGPSPPNAAARGLAPGRGRGVPPPGRGGVSWQRGGALASTPGVVRGTSSPTNRPQPFAPLSSGGALPQVKPRSHTTLPGGGIQRAVSTPAPLQVNEQSIGRFRPRPPVPTPQPRPVAPTAAPTAAGPSPAGTASSSGVRIGTHTPPTGVRRTPPPTAPRRSTTAAAVPPRPNRPRPPGTTAFSPAQPPATASRSAPSVGIGMRPRKEVPVPPVRTEAAPRLLTCELRTADGERHSFAVPAVAATLLERVREHAPEGTLLFAHAGLLRRIAECSELASLLSALAPSEALQIRALPSDHQCEHPKLSVSLGSTSFECSARTLAEVQAACTEADSSVNAETKLSYQDPEWSTVSLPLDDDADFTLALSCHHFFGQASPFTLTPSK